MEFALPLHRPQIANRQHPRQPPPALPGQRIGDYIRRIIRENQPCACDQFEILPPPFRPRVFQCPPRPDNACNAIAIRYPQPGVAKRNRRLHHLIRLRRAAQE